MLHKAKLIMLLSLMLAGCSTVNVTDSPPQGEQLSFGRDIHLLAQLPDEVIETSGLAARGNLLWTINDSGDGPFLYALDKDRRLHKKVELLEAKNTDWEELAQDKEFLYVADCGNNRGYRQQLQIYKVRWSELDSAEQSVPTQKITFEYADREDAVDPKNHNYDCEALTAVDNELWLFTKNRKDQKTNLYRLNKDQSFQRVQASSVYDVKGLITAADYEPGSQYLALLGYEKNVIFGSSFLWLVPVNGDGLKQPVWEQAQRKTLSPYAQWESIKWDVKPKGARLLFTSEKSPLLDVSIGYIDVSFPAVGNGVEK